LFEVYFALLRFIVQGSSFCQMQNSTDGHARCQSGSFPRENPTRGRRLKHDLTDYKTTVRFDIRKLNLAGLPYWARANVDG
jgi:hypothetical protein